MLKGCSQVCRISAACTGSHSVEKTMIQGRKVHASKALVLERASNLVIVESDRACALHLPCRAACEDHSTFQASFQGS